MKNKQEILKKIQKKNGDNIIGLLKVMEQDGYSEEVRDKCLLGFLKSKETMVAVFGELTEVCSIHGDSLMGEEMNLCYSCDGVPPESLVEWQYHHNQTAGFTAIETLEYMEKYL